MNPFTKQLLEGIHDPTIRSFTEQWDAFEALVLRIFRQKQATSKDQADHKKLLQQLSRSYALLASSLAPHWKQTQIRGQGNKIKQPTLEDPFLKLLQVPEAQGFALNRQAFLTLPPAREALNSFLLAQKEPHT